MSGRRGILGKAGVDQQLVLDDAHLVHLKQGVDLRLQRDGQARQRVARRMQEAAGHAQPPVGAAHDFNAVKPVLAAQGQVHRQLAGMAGAEQPAQAQHGEILLQIDLRALQRQPAVAGARGHGGRQGGAQVVVEPGLADFKGRGPFDRGLPQLVEHPERRLALGVQALQLRPAGRPMGHPGSPAERAENQEQERVAECFHRRMRRGAQEAVAGEAAGVDEAAPPLEPPPVLVLLAELLSESFFAAAL